MRIIRAFLLANIFLLSFASSGALPQYSAATDNSDAGGASPTQKSAPPIVYRELQIYGAQSFGYPQILSDLPGQRVTIVGLRLTTRTVYVRPRYFTLFWSADIKPLVLYSNDIYGPRQYTYGGGAGPGLLGIPHNHWKNKPFFEVNGGFLAFTKNTPTPETRRVNMSFDFGPGIFLHAGENRAVKIGGSFFHFSNAWTVKTNPGMDTFLVYAAYVFQDFHFRKGGS
jgi:Lipid A 3-O-deacylase (PagL)